MVHRLLRDCLDCLQVRCTMITMTLRRTGLQEGHGHNLQGAPNDWSCAHAVFLAHRSLKGVDIAPNSEDKLRSDAWPLVLDTITEHRTCYAIHQLISPTGHRILPWNQTRVSPHVHER